MNVIIKLILVILWNMSKPWMSLDKLDKSLVKSQLMYIVEINNKFYNYRDPYQFIQLNNVNIQIVCYVRYESTKSEITKLIYQYQNLT